MLNLAKWLLSCVLKIVLMKSGQKWPSTQAAMLVEGDNPLNAPKNVRMLGFCSRADGPKISVIMR